MRRLLAICCAAGLLCGALGCQCCHGSGHEHGRCDCDDEPGYGCHWEMFCHGADHEAAHAPTPPVAEPIKDMPKPEPK